MIKCAIVDDEPLALGLMESYVRKTPMLELCGSYTSAVEALDGLRKSPVSLLFLDIQMPEMSGLDLSKMIDAEHTRIVFTTAFSQYAIDGYKVSALDYLLKPVSYTDFIGAVGRAQKWMEQSASPQAPSAGKNAQEALPATDSGNDGYIFVKSDYKILRINLEEILYIEGLKDYVKIYLDSTARPVLSLIAMRSMEEALPAAQFFRVHRSYIVNISKIQVYERGQIVFGDKRIPVSDSYKNMVQEYINAHLLQGRC